MAEFITVGDLHLRISLIDSVEKFNDTVNGRPRIGIYIYTNNEKNPYSVSFNSAREMEDAYKKLLEVLP